MNQQDSDILSMTADGLLTEPVELGHSHPFENFISSIVDNEFRARWLSTYYEKQCDIERKRSIILTIGRQSCVDGLGFLLRIALQDSHIMVRESAVRSAEAIGGDLALETLTGYQEKVPWLSRYIEGVIVDLTKKIM